MARALLGLDAAESKTGGRGAGVPAATARPTTDGVPAAPFALAVGPNPAASSVAVTLTLAEAGDVSVAVYDLLGRAVAVPLAGTLTAGTHRSTVDVSALAPGVYVVRAAANMEAGTVVRAARLTVAR